MKNPFRPGTLLAGVLGLFASAVSFAVTSWVQSEPSTGAFPLVHDNRAATIVTAPEDFKVVAVVANDLAADVERVTGIKPAVATAARGPAVLVGTLGSSALIDGLVAAGKLDVEDLRGKWESFVITTITQPLPGVPSALVIAGSDRRGTAFGVYELSQAIGVSPWYWWADVTPVRRSALYVAPGTRRFGPPSVQYRGIFINDEDWGLQPWAAKTFEPETGDIGPKTYAKVCELLLRLKANTLWPAMHPSTKAFNAFPQNKQVADDYAIVMGSSHAEPMLRNNVGEWTAPKETYDYIHNRTGVLAYWEQRMKENGRFENIYTLGMRGIHDSNMIGPKTDAERIATLEKIFADQRALIAKYAKPATESAGPPLDGVRGRPQGTPLPVEQIPQMFCAYKEVLALYRQGLKVPDDVTIVWPDDNFGYIRNFASPDELRRSGGFGVYYHISYLGAPLSYLWLSTTPPALIWEEMSKAYDHGARKIWIVNVGDIKPAEIGLEFFLQMAWDIQRWRRETVADYLKTWAAREFGAVNAEEIADIMAGYYRLNFVRRPEHLQWWLPGRPPQPLPFSAAEIEERLAHFKRLETRASIMRPSIPPERRDAYDELVSYPVRGSAMANRRFFFGEAGLPEAAAENQVLIDLTAQYNRLARGKWNRLMNLEPADDTWKSMRIAAWKMPEVITPPAPDPVSSAIVVSAGSFNDRVSWQGAAWETVPGLGHSGRAVAVFPTTMPAWDGRRPPQQAPRLEYSVDFTSAGEFTVTIHLLPTHALVAGTGLRLGLGLDDDRPQVVVCDRVDGSAEWAQGVLNNDITVTARLKVQEEGRHLLRVYGLDAGVVVDKLVIDTAPSGNAAPP